MAEHIHDDPVATFEAERSRLRALAYRMLGTLGDAEDAVQDTYLRWHRTDRSTVRKPQAWLVSACTRICIDRLRRARTERDAYIGPWLPEPMVVETQDSPTLDDTLSLAFLVVLERLSPAERAAWLLHEAFEYDYGEVASALEKSEEACRQLVSRANRHLKAARPRFAPDRAQADALAMRFAKASLTGDRAALMDMLAPDAELWSDGGGKAVAALNVITGADRVMRFVVGITRKQPAEMQRTPVRINGMPGVIGHLHGAPRLTLSLDIVDGRIAGIYIVRNPDKLKRLPSLV
ncbi:RNA polymerase sigma factor SigJ [Reyranella sp. CPCC 100927]|uniref:RNA polymerase sigma factor SigJ n=1 Tax=Reyranella sp. CPCC 100927 TaxID=2599616 RepID=UPI0011B4529A|nr:RNA polymerase sigma factor SigJ [Reyranella sp. CPCC 100927]TWT15394.1 RNA polymerase sigma-70 factor [Reyranella sp. CPCC 100927]